MSEISPKVRAELKDFLNEVKCPNCASALKVAPVWEFVFDRGYSTCGSCWQVFTLKSGAKLEGFSVNSDDLEVVADDYVTGTAGGHIWDAAAVENSRGAAVDFFISLAFTAFFDGLERSYPELRNEDYEMALHYLAQAGALAVEAVDTRLIADAFEKFEKYKPYGWTPNAEAASGNPSS